MSEMGFFRHFNAPLERHFTVVHWDQRGTGKSFDRNIPRSSMTLEQFVADSSTSSSTSCAGASGKRKSRSWATPGDWRSARSTRRDFRRKSRSTSAPHRLPTRRPANRCRTLRTRRSGAAARRQGFEEAARDWSAAYPAKSVFVERTVVTRLDGQMRLGILWRAGRALFGRPESSILDLPNLVRGFGFTLDAMWAEVSKLNLLTLGARIEDASGHLRRTPRSLGAARDERGVLRCADRAVEDTGVVRTLRPRGIRRRT